MKILILEDDINRIEWFIRFMKKEFPTYQHWYTDNVEQAKSLFKEHGPFDYYFLDHDLGGEQMVDSSQENTGYQFAKFLEENGITGENETIILHSLNPSGRDLMKHCFKQSQIMPLILLGYKIKV